MSPQSHTILAIETATSACSAALLCNDKVTGKLEVGSNIHSKSLLGMIDALFDEAGINAKDLNAVCVGKGPGSFTGLRIGVGVAQGIAYGAHCPMVGVISLDALANAATRVKDAGTLIAATDARMGEVYWAEYSISDGQIDRISDPMVSLPQNIYSEAERVFLVGNAWAEYQTQFDSGLIDKLTVLNEIVYPDAIEVLALGEQKLKRNEVESATEFAPIYVRDDVAKKSERPLPGRRI